MNKWDKLKMYTQARIGLKRAGHSISTRDLLDFQTAHALARDAVHQPWDVKAFVRKFRAAGEKPLLVNTGVSLHEQYLKYPTLGRILREDSRKKLERYKKRHHVDIVFIVTDGLSVRAINTHLIPFWKVFKTQLATVMSGLKFVWVIAPFGRVALGDDVGKALGAKMSVILVGERPGLSAVDSLGIYLTYDPKPGNCDANRNCLSNIHPPEGLAYAIATQKLLYLMAECFRLKLSGVNIKEETIYLTANLNSRLGLGI